MRELTSLERQLMYFQVRIPPHTPPRASTPPHARAAAQAHVLPSQVTAASPALSVPPPAREVSVWHARDHAVLLPWGVLLSAVRAVVFANRSVERYQDYVWAHGCTFVSEAPRR